MSKIEKLKIAGHSGTWYEIDRATINGKKLYLMESEQWGDEAPSIIMDDQHNVILDDVRNGFDDYREMIAR